MGDIANMTDCDGRVNGSRLLRWLRSRAEGARAEEKRYASLGAERTSIYHGSRAELLDEMADDLEREITPPDYSEDDGGGASGFTAEHYRLLDGLTAPNDRETPAYDEDTGPCDDCGRLAHRVPVSDNGRVWLACPDCAERAKDDTVDMDDPAFLGRPEQE